MKLNVQLGIVDQARWLESPNCDARPDNEVPSAIIVHCISLPPGEYGGDHIGRFFQNKLAVHEHDYFASMAHLRVSSHFLLRRDGELVQFVATNKRAWHAGESQCLQRARVNDFSIGIELEGLDTDSNGFTSDQYRSFNELITELRQHYPKIANNIFAHSDIAPGRKPDPGPFFDWSQVNF